MKKSLRIAGILGIIGALAATISDILLLYSPKGQYGGPDYINLLGISMWRLSVGHYLGILMLPLLIFGFWQIYQGLKPVGKWRSLPVYLLNSFAVIVGTGAHATMAYLTLIVQAKAKASAEMQGIFSGLFESSKFFNEPLLSLLQIFSLIAAIWLIVAVLSKRSLYPRWFALFNPILITFVFALPYLVFPASQISRILLPAAFNLAHAMFFGVSTFLLWNYDKVIAKKDKV